jgi:hypothetical protein
MLDAHAGQPQTCNAAINAAINDAAIDDDAIDDAAIDDDPWLQQQQQAVIVHLPRTIALLRVWPCTRGQQGENTTGVNVVRATTPTAISTSPTGLIDRWPLDGQADAPRRRQTLAGASSMDGSMDGSVDGSMYGKVVA